jgi:hypothetical protein
LSKVLQNVIALTDIDVDFDLFLLAYSKIIHELLICSILAEDTEGVIFSANVCGELVALPQHFDDVTTVLDTLKMKISPKLDTLKELFSPHFDQKKKAFADLGLTESNAYLFLQGHKLLDNVVKPLLEHYTYRLKNKHLAQIKLITNSDERNAVLQKYLNQTISVEKALKANETFKECPFFVKIKENIKIISI